VVRPAPRIRPPPTPEAVKTALRGTDEQVSEGASVTLRTAHGQFKADSVEDLKGWLRGLTGCPPITRVVAARCERPLHGAEPGTWFYVEADAAAGVARLRCLGCADVTSVLDSADRWTFPSAWACHDCRQSIAEVAYGIHEESGAATWMALAARCVDCGSVAGLTDVVVPDLPVDEFVSSL
jgi:hypothetical protein